MVFCIVTAKDTSENTVYVSVSQFWRRQNNKTLATGKRDCPQSKKRVFFFNAAMQMQ